MSRSRRFAVRAGREINKDSFVHEWPAAGLILMGAPADPRPGLVLQRDMRVDAGLFKNERGNR